MERASFKDIYFFPNRASASERLLQILSKLPRYFVGSFTLLLLLPPSRTIMIVICMITAMGVTRRHNGRWIPGGLMREQAIKYHGTIVQLWYSVDIYIVAVSRYLHCLVHHPQSTMPHHRNIKDSRLVSGLLTQSSYTDGAIKSHGDWVYDHGRFFRVLFASWIC